MKKITLFLLLLSMITVSCKTEKQAKLDNRSAITEWEAAKNQLYQLQQDKKPLDGWAINVANLIETSEPYFIPYQTIYDMADKCEQCRVNWVRMTNMIDTKNPTEDDLNVLAHWKEKSPTAQIIDPFIQQYHIHIVEDLRDKLKVANNRERDSLLTTSYNSLWLVDRIIFPIQYDTHPLIKECDTYYDSLYTKETAEYVKTFHYSRDKVIPDYAFLGDRGGMLRSLIVSQLKKDVTQADLDGASNIYFEMERDPIEVKYTNQLSSTRKGEDILRIVNYTNSDIKQIIQDEMYKKAITCTDIRLLQKFVSFSRLMNLYDDERQIQIYNKYITLANDNISTLLSIKEQVTENREKNRIYSEEFDILIRQIDKKIQYAYKS